LRTPKVFVLIAFRTFSAPISAFGAQINQPLVARRFFRQAIAMRIVS
jgi:hypothetical protein